MATSLCACTLHRLPRLQSQPVVSLAQPQRSLFAPACVSRRGRKPLTCRAAKGFAPNSKSKGKSGNRESNRKLDQSWIAVGSLTDFPNDRPTRAVTLKDKSVVMLYNIDGEVYCSDANSTAFQYPLTHAKIVPGQSGPAVEVPFDGTIYDLETGKVLEWCPKNNLFRKLLGSIKSTEQPKKLKVYPTQVDDEGKIYAKFYTAA